MLFKANIRFHVCIIVSSASEKTKDRCSGTVSGDIVGYNVLSCNLNNNFFCFHYLKKTLLTQVSGSHSIIVSKNHHLSSEFSTKNCKQTRKILQNLYIKRI